MALLRGYRYLAQNERIVEGTMVKTVDGIQPSRYIGDLVIIPNLYMVPIAKPRHVRSYTPQETSLEARASQKDKAPADREKILGEIRHRESGRTCDELEVSMHLSHQTASARVRDLAKASKIVDSGLRRRTRTGRNAIVWKALVPC